MITRLSLRRRERALPPIPDSVTSDICLPRLVIPVHQLQQAARKDTRASRIHIRRANEVENVVETSAPHGCGCAPWECSREDGEQKKKGHHDPDGTEVQRTSRERIEQNELHGGVITRLSSRKKGRTLATVPADSALRTDLPCPTTLTYQRQQATRKDAQTGGTNTRKTREVENTVGICTPRRGGCAPHEGDRGDREYEMEERGEMIECSGLCGGGNSGNDVDGRDALLDVVGRGGVVSDFVPDKKQTSAAAFVGRKRKQATITNSQPVTDKQLIPLGPVTRSRSRVQIPAKP